MDRPGIVEEQLFALHPRKLGPGGSSGFALNHHASVSGPEELLLHRVKLKCRSES